MTSASPAKRGVYNSQHPRIADLGGRRPTHALQGTNLADARLRSLSLVRWQTGEQMPEWHVILDVAVPQEVAAFATWQGRWRDHVVISENEGCGCCVDIWTITGPAEARTELPTELVGANP